MIDTLWDDYAEVQVLLAVGASDGSDPVFTLDDPTFGRLDYGVLGSLSAPFVDVTCDVRSLDWQFGATRTDGILTRWEAGSCVVVLGNNDSQYPIGDDSSPYVPMIQLLVQTRLVQPTVGPWVPQFSGYCNSYALGFDAATLDATVTVAATDGTELLTAYDVQVPVALAGEGETSAQRVSRILDFAQWSGPRNIAAGGRALAATDLSGDAWSQLLAVNDAELGAVYIAPDGTATFITRETLFSHLSSTAAPVATFGPDDGALRYEDATVVVDDQLLRNIVDAQRPGGAVQTAQNIDSVEKYRPHRYGRTDLVLDTDADVSAWASLVVNAGGTPFARVDDLTVWPRTDPANLFPLVVNTHYLDRWSVEVQPPGTTTDVERTVLVRGWHTTIDREDWTTVYALSTVEGFDPFILDDPGTRLDAVRLGV